jgi:predicted AlkP superfamily pyrophosphatase or phosphodiesterase
MKISRPVAALSPLLVSLALLAGCASSPAAETPSPPRLVVLIVIDGLPQWQVVDYREQLAPDGFRRFLDRGTWFSNANYGYAFTVTAAGHATMLSGAYPHRSGIIGNEWRDPKSGQTVYCTGDTAYTYIGHKTAALDGTSPRNMLVETLGDVMKRQSGGKARVIGISGKDRGAILPAGHTGTAYMYMAQTGQFASTTYYMKEHPAWVSAFNAAKPADKFFGATWSPLLPEAAYAKSVPDNSPWFNKGGKLPKKIGEGQDIPGPLFYGELMPTPFGDELTLAFARAAVEGESLGADEVTDILSVSLSSHDYVNHAWGAESRMSHDHALQLDRHLATFFGWLDERVGKDNYVVVLSADHGFMPVPEYSKTLGRDAGRQNTRETTARLNASLAPKFGAGEWATGFSAYGIVLNNKLIAEKKVDGVALQEEMRRLLLQEPGISAALLRPELENGTGPAGQPYDRLRKTWYRERSPDIQLASKPYWMLESSRSSATTHGSAWEYDTHVPILFYGPRWVRAARVDEPAEVADIAPTLAAIVGVPAPAQSEGRARALR